MFVKCSVSDMVPKSGLCDFKFQNPNPLCSKFPEFSLALVSKEFTRAKKQRANMIFYHRRHKWSPDITKSDNC